MLRQITNLGIACTTLVACWAISGGCSALSTEVGSGGSNAGYSSSGVGAGGEIIPPTGETFVGLGCATDDECGDHPNSFCVTADDSQSIFTSFWSGVDDGGGVAGGYCTRTCADSDCPTGSRCGGGVCLKQCDFGSPTLTNLDDGLSRDKCHGRDDLMCVPSSGGDAVCMPNCGATEACGGRACDARYGVCTGPDRTGFSDGSTCDADNGATPEDEDLCSGLCLELLDAKERVVASICSSRCSLGGDGNDCGGASVGACAIPRVEATGGVEGQLGDQGFCASACTAHDTCGYDVGIFCLNLGEPGTTNGNGYCVPAEPCEGVMPCAGPLECTETIDGRYCLDSLNGETTYDLGAAAP